MHVLGCGRDPAKLQRLESEVADRERLATLSVDVMEDSGPKRIVEFALQRWGHINSWSTMPAAAISGAARHRR
jgi:NADP-dependent 3-hydroxy acid dehydrogenase YdfG